MLIAKTDWGSKTGDPNLFQWHILKGSFYNIIRHDYIFTEFGPAGKVFPKIILGCAGSGHAWTYENHSNLWYNSVKYYL